MAMSGLISTRFSIQPIEELTPCASSSLDSSRRERFWTINSRPNGERNRGRDRQIDREIEEAENDWRERERKKKKEKRGTEGERATKFEGKRNEDADTEVAGNSGFEKGDDLGKEKQIGL